jgi:prophage regulatory protein
MSIKNPTNPSEQSSDTQADFQNNIDRLVRLKEFLRLTGLGRSTVYKLISEGLLERPIHISTRTIGWHASTVRAFIESRQS